MLNISTTLKQALLDGRVCRYVRVILKSGGVISITDHNKPLDIAGTTYQPSPNLNAIQMLQVKGTQVSAQKVFSTWFEGIFNMDDVNAGVYDDAELQVGWAGWALDPIERMVIFSGTVGEITFNDEGLSMEALDDMKLLEDNFGRTYTVTDPYTFGDPQFGLDENDYLDTGSVNFVLSNRLKLKADGNMTSQASGWFTFGKLTFTSGLNTGYSGEVKIHTKDPDPLIDTSIEFFIPTPYPFSAGDTFEIIAGYDGSLEQSRDKFNNVANFGGFPFIQSSGEQD